MPAINLSSAYSQDFDSLANTGTPAWQDDTTLVGWYSNRTTYLPSTGTSNTGSLYSFGTQDTTERAFGSVASGSTNNILYGARFVNNTTNPVTSLNISYFGEQWRRGDGVANRLDFQYQVGASTLTTGTWTDFDGLDFVAPITTGSGVALDGNISANRTSLSGSISGLTINPGQEVWLRWSDANETGGDDGLGIDSFSISATFGSPQPPPAASISLTLPSFSGALLESAGANTNPGARTSVVATVTRTGDLSAPLTINLSSNISSATVPASVTIEANQSSTTFTITAQDDTVINGSRTATITASASGLTSQTVNVRIDDDDFATRIATVSANSYSTGAAEIPAYDPVSKRLFVVNGNLKQIDVFDLSNPTSPTSLAPITFTGALAGSIPNSVAARNGIVAVALEAPVKTNPGQAAFYNAATGVLINSVQVGALPDMIVFSPDGTRVLTANEGEPNSYNNVSGTTSVDPEGSVSIINISGGISAATVTTASFTSFNSQAASLRTSGVRIFGPNASVAQDLEPEYIAFSGDGATAYVTLQENNAVAVIDVGSATVTSIRPLGLKNYGTAGNGFDPSDRDNAPGFSSGTINIRTDLPVFGMYQPDAIATFTVGGTTYYVTANEGEARSDWPGFSDEVRAGASGYVLDPTTFPNASTLKLNQNLGRLNVTNATGDTDGDLDFDQIQTFGTRSFTIWNASTGAQVYDSGDFLEQLTASYYPNNFNAGHTTNSLDDRSDNKGPEPEGVVIGTIGSRTYAFVGLERIGGIIIQDVTNPTNPTFVQYLNTRNFAQTPGLNSGGDLGIEGLTFVSEKDSPNGRPLLITSNEVSGTSNIFQINTLRIRDIQGAGHISPLVGQTVNNISGIVTARRSNGFYLQDPNPDSNDATSEAIFVFTSSAPTVNVGDSVSVNGTVGEFRPGGSASPGLSITQITSPVISVLSTGNPLPTATIIGSGGRVLPNSTIYATSTPVNVETSGTFAPATNGLDFYESLEGMRVQVNNAVAVSPTNNFGEIWILADNGAGATGRNSRGGITISATDFNPERIQLDDTLLPSGTFSPSVDVGAKFTTPITGVVDYSFNNYEVLTTSFPNVTATPLAPETTTLQGNLNQLSVASFNVENFSPAAATEAGPWGASRANAIAAQIVSRLKSPDIIGLQEIQDNNGTTNDGVVAANQSYQTLINAIVAAGGPTYQFANIDPVNNTNGGAPGANIRPGFLYNPNRVTFNSISLIDPTNPAFNASRKPVAAEFTFNGQAITFVNNHFNSKGGDQPLFGANQPPTLITESQRLQQAQVVNDFVDTKLTTNPNANIVVLGDLNDFGFSKPLEVIRGLPGTPVLNDLAASLPGVEQYSYNFEGNSQTLDHILVSNSLLPGSSFDIVHINSEFAAQTSDHDPKVALFSLALNGAGGKRLFTIPFGEGSREILNFGGVGGSATEVDTLKFEGSAGQFNVSNLLLRQVGLDTVIQFDGVANNQITLKNFFIENLGNLSPERGNFLFERESTISPSFQVIAPTAQLGRVVRSNNVTFLNELDNNTRGRDNSNDVINAQGGNDTIQGFSGDDILRGDVGDDFLLGGLGNDTLSGGSGSDRLLGQVGDDELAGGEGNDLLNGGDGVNTLTGGAGLDTFLLGLRANNRIRDFADGQDLLQLTGRLNFADLQISQGIGGNAADTFIRLQRNGQILAVLDNVQASTITIADFV